MTHTPASLVSCLLVALCVSGVHGDGKGLIGWGKTMYNPTCSFACRSVLSKQQLACTPVDTSVNHGTNHNPVATPPDCFVKDPVFLKTMALCIDTYCPLSDAPSDSLINDYWASHLGTGTLGDYSYVPAMSYQDALIAGRDDESKASAKSTSTAHGDASHDHMDMRILRARQHSHDSGEEEQLAMETFDVSSPLPVAAGGSGSLNVTSFVDPTDWQLQWNYLSDFETNEAGHSTMT